MKENTTRTSVVSLAVAAVLACGTDTSMQLGSRFLASTNVDASGGGFSVDADSELDGLRLEVPPGAVDSEVRVGVSPAASLPLEADIEWVGPAADFSPDGQQFAAPVRITLPLSQSTDDRETVVRVVSADGTRELLAGRQIQLSEGFLSFEIDHFTRFQPGRRRRPTGSCTSDADCRQGDECQRGVCGPAPAPKCRVDGDCGTGEVCSATGTCVAGPECTTDADCDQGEECSRRSQSCVPAPAGCSADADCNRDEVCARRGAALGMCVAGNCTEDADCARDEECSASFTCVPVPECRTDADCARGESCSPDGTCAPAPECRTDQDCVRSRLGRVCARGVCV